MQLSVFRISIEVTKRINKKKFLSWDKDWKEPYLNITNNPEIYNQFKNTIYKNWRFDRVEGEEPPDWVRFTTFSSTPDNSDLADVLVLTREATAAMGHDGDKFIQQCTYNQRHCSAR